MYLYAEDHEEAITEIYKERNDVIGFVVWEKSLL